jgi:hypothetical protein
LAAIRSTMRQQFLKSPLGDVPRVAADFAELMAGLHIDAQR